jgi:LEA14-like dessication related protein
LKGGQIMGTKTNDSTTEKMFGKRRPMLLFIAMISMILLPGFSFKAPSVFKKRPSAQIENVDIIKITFKDITFLFDVKISNPYPLGINLAGVNMDLHIENKPFLKTSAAKGVKIPAKKSRKNQFTLNLKYSEIMRLIKAYQSKDYLNVTIKGNILINLPRVKIRNFPRVWSVPFKLARKIPAIKPTIDIKNFKVQMPKKRDVINSLRKAGKESVKPEKVINYLDMVFSKKKKRAKDIMREVAPRDLDLKLKVKFDIVLKNKTRARLNFKKLDYNFYVKNQLLVKGNTSNIRKVANKMILTVASEFSTKALSKSVLAAFKSKLVDFRLDGSTMIQLPPKIKKTPVKLKINEARKFRL